MHVTGHKGEAAAKAYVFFVLSCRMFDVDWRISLFEAMKERVDYYHLRLGRNSILTDPKSRQSRSYRLWQIPALVRDIGAKIRAGAVPVYFVTTATAVPSLVIALRLFLRKGIWLFDVYDDYSQYMGTCLQNVKGHLINASFYWIATATIVAPPNLKRKFKSSFILNVGSNIQPLQIETAGSKDILVTSNFDPRLDYEFIRALAKRCPEREFHLYGRVNNRARDWPALQNLLHASPNIKYCGEFADTAFSRILSRHAVALVPFKMNVKFTRSTDPSRFYDYLNAGLEVISTDIPRAREQAEFVHTVGSVEEAVEVLRQLDMTPSLRRSGRWKYREHTWRRRSQQLLEIVNSLAD